MSRALPSLPPLAAAAALPCLAPVERLTPTACSARPCIALCRSHRAACASAVSSASGTESASALAIRLSSRKHVRSVSGLKRMCAAPAASRVSMIICSTLRYRLWPPPAEIASSAPPPCPAIVISMLMTGTTAFPFSAGDRWVASSVNAGTTWQCGPTQAAALLYT